MITNITDVVLSFDNYSAAVISILPAAAIVTVMPGVWREDPAAGRDGQDLLVTATMC